MVAVLTSFINYNIRYTNIEKEIKKNAIKLANNRRMMLREYIKDATNRVKSVAINPIMQDYMKNLHTNSSKQKSKNQKEFYKNQVINLFFSQMDSYDNMMKIRYIDEDGKEIIRLDRKKNQTNAHIVKNLQNKSHRYYYIETSKLLPNTFWYSNLDLNLEHGKIEYPIIPTLRVSTPLYFKRKFRGFIIISLKIKIFFELFQNSNDFNIYIVDKDGEFIVHPDSAKSWSRYLDKGYTLYNEKPNIAKNILTQKEFFYKLIYSVELSSILKNGDDAKLIIEPNSNIIEQLKKNNIKNAFIIIFTVIIVSLPLSLLIAYVPSKLQRKLQNALDELSKKSKIIDQHVIVSSTDREGKITDVSTAFSNITKYKKEELIGRTHSIIKNNSNSPEFYQKLWDTIINGHIWKGEIQNQNKSGTPFWLSTIITPEYDEFGNPSGYIAISHDISDKKRIEEISITDQLTKIYNRYKLDEMFGEEIQNAINHDTPLSIIIIDIDKFKSVNDTYGHLVGDLVLIEIATLIKNNVRKQDIFGRWGGEEFLILLPNTSLEDAISLGENLREIIEHHQFPTVHHKTASFGVATMSNNETIDDIVRRADKALYIAKESGRNQVQFIGS